MHCTAIIVGKNISSVYNKFMKYEDLIFKIPKESKTYQDDSDSVIKSILEILDKRKDSGDDKIIINTNLQKGLPFENINKIAGPMTH